MAKITGFNYAIVSDEDVRQRLQEQARAIRELLERTGACIVDVGRRLIEVRDSLPNVAAFQAWVKAEFRWSECMAWTYVAAARRLGDVDCLEQFQPFAIYTLCRRNVPAAAIADAVKLAKQGELITGVKARAILKAHDVQPTRRDAGRPRKLPQPADVLATLQGSLDALTAGLDQLVSGMPREDREALAEQFLSLALRLKMVDAGRPVAKNAKPRRRAAVGAA